MRAFASAHEWSVLGLHQDMSVHYPVPPLLGAFSAQCQLAIAGEWGTRSAMAAMVQVRTGGSSRGRDELVHLTTLDTGPLSLQFTATFTDGHLDLVALGHPDDAAQRRLATLLKSAREAGDFQRGDHVAADDVELLHSRAVSAGGVDVDPAPHLDALARLAAALTGPST